MAMLPIVTGVENKILRAKSAPVKKIDRKLKKLIADMAETMQAVDGLGIAAPQVGVNLRIYIARLNFNTPNEMIVPMLNAEFLEKSDGMENNEEGCLSIPG
ncbi:peptide deformylase, partial [Candidatus Peregrinibacteria bacterium]|nr:peptide deformylase [Candidatus Peregrinibacteria bacterium]